MQLRNKTTIAYKSYKKVIQRNYYYFTKLLSHLLLSDHTDTLEELSGCNENTATCLRPRIKLIGAATEEWFKKYYHNIKKFQLPGWKGLDEVADDDMQAGDHKKSSSGGKSIHTHTTLSNEGVLCTFSCS